MSPVRGCQKKNNEYETLQQLMDEGHDDEFVGRVKRSGRKFKSGSDWTQKYFTAELNYQHKSRANNIENIRQKNEEHD